MRLCKIKSRIMSKFYIEIIIHGIRVPSFRYTAKRTTPALTRLKENQTCCYIDVIFCCLQCLDRLLSCGPHGY